MLNLLLSFLFIAATIQAAAYCSLSVKIRNPSGQFVERTVVVEENTGIKTEQIANGGIARFCNLGFLPVSVTVGFPACNQLTVRNVPLQWNVTRELLVTYVEAPC